jgi:hypothetical protein
MYKKILLTSTIFAVMPFTALSFYQPSALPVISSTPITNTNEDAPYAYAAAAFDTDAADTLSWAVKSGETLPGWLALSNGSISTTDVGDPITGPGGVAMDAAGNIYVAGLSGTTIFKITPDGTQTSFATVASSSKYGMLVIGSTLYVSYYNLNKITKIDLNNPSAGESDWIPSIIDPLAMLEKDGFLYVAQYSANKVSKIDLSNNVVTDVVTGTPYPFGIGFSQDGTLYIASYNNKYISSFKDNVLSANIKSFSSSLSDIKIDSSGNIYVSTFGSGVKRVTPDLSTATDISTTGRVWGMSIAPSGALIWGINDFNKVVKLETGTILSGTPTNDNVGDHDICLTVTDATNNVDQCFTLTVNNVNDAPVAENNTGLSLDEGAAGTIGQTELEFSDVDATDTPGNLTYTLTTVPIYGSLKLNGNALALNGTFSQQDINGALVSYQHDDSENFSDSFGFSFADGLEDSITAITGQTFTFTLNNVNDNPTVNNAPSELVLSEDTSGQIDLSGMTLADTDSANITLTLTMSGGVFTAPADGSIIGSGVTATLVNATVITLTGSTADINAYLDGISNIQYTGANNASGDNAASLTISASDGTSDINLSNISVNITAVNDQPILQGDNFVFAKNTNNSYSLDVLANDTDVDGDTLIIEGVNASIGDVSVDNGIVVYQAPENYVGNVSFNYSVRDGQKGRAQASAQLEITGVQEGQPPVITLPGDVEVNATGLFTKIDLGVATAVDALGNPLSVTLVDGITFFKPGNNIAYWQAIDNAGNQTIAEQKVVVQPLISISKDQVVSEGSTVTVRVLLNGMAPQYPLDIPFSVSGSALADTDYTLAQGNLVITSGTQAELVFAVLSDDEVETDETVIVNLNSNFNLGAKNSSTIRISEANIAPSINLFVRQNDENRFTVSQVDGLVRIQAQVSDPNPNDQLTNVWVADQALVNTSSDALIFEFDPSALSTDVYKATLTTTDTGLLSDSQTVYINLVNSLASLTAIDTDGDLIPDNEEGYADTDGDGIPDYLDAISECNVVPSQSMTQDSFLVEGEPGVCLRKGLVSIASESGGLLVDNSQAENDLTVDEDVTISGDIVDFIAYGLPEKGQNYRLVNPQSRPIPENAIYRKYSQTNGWFNFVEDEQNQLSSTKGERGYCPSPGDISWSAGLTAGDWCVQLQIEDGGPNDDDGLANGAIVDPGGVAVVNQGNQLPVANNDSAELPWNMIVTIDVLNNDTDADNDMLEVSSASASFGEVIVNNDNTITYTPNLNYAGNDTINYGITDGQGGSDSAQVMVTVQPNRAPVAQNDEITIDGSTTVDVNVLSNDSDIDGDTLSIELATAQSGQVAVNNNRLSYTAGDFIGEDIIIYTINDGQGSQANGILTVTVTGTKAVKVNNTSSGGGSGIWSLLTLFAALLMRRQSTQTAQQHKGVKS